jgi:hypothetical protein
MNPRPRLAWLTIYALAMALVEAAIVIHLRHLYSPADPQTLFPLVLLGPEDLLLELVRELATIVMIGTVAVLAEHGWSRRFAVFVYVFGVWDLAYYAWLKLFLDWPRAWLEWDVLFLIPWPWFGPWLSAALIALLFTLWGGWVLAGAQVPRWTRGDVLLFLAGAMLGLAAFLAPAWPLLSGGAAAFRDHAPDTFSWLAHGLGLGAMAAALFRTGRR